MTNKDGVVAQLDDVTAILEGALLMVEMVETEPQLYPKTIVAMGALLRVTVERLKHVARSLDAP
jgi:hypothetical protein